MMPVDGDPHGTLYLLNMPLMDEDVLDTQLDETALLEVYGAALDEGLGRVPEAAPPSEEIVESPDDELIAMGEVISLGDSDDDSSAEDLDGASYSSSDPDDPGSDASESA